MGPVKLTHKRSHQGWSGVNKREDRDLVREDGKEGFGFHSGGTKAIESFELSGDMIGLRFSQDPSGC